MAKQNVVILGSTGMLGSMLLRLFTESGEFDITATYRDKDTCILERKYSEVKFISLDVEKANLKKIKDVIRGSDWIINTIGVIKPYIHDSIGKEIDRAMLVNAHFPYLLSEATRGTNSKVIQIATDCVYSGLKGGYVETDLHDATDVYGKTKSLGEVYGKNIFHLRCSIIGPEIRGHKSLLDWCIRQPKGATINGFTNQQWNGITSFHFARICRGIIENRVKLPHIQHIVPADSVSKAKLLKIMRKEFERKDVIIENTKIPTAINRILATNNPKLNQKLWEFAGFKTIPTVQQMVKELSNI